MTPTAAARSAVQLAVGRAPLDEEMTWPPAPLSRLEQRSRKDFTAWPSFVEPSRQLAQRCRDRARYGSSEDATHGQRTGVLYHSGILLPAAVSFEDFREFLLPSCVRAARLARRRGHHQRVLRLLRQAWPETTSSARGWPLLESRTDGLVRVRSASGLSSAWPATRCSRPGRAAAEEARALPRPGTPAPGNAEPAGHDVDDSSIRRARGR